AAEVGVESEVQLVGKLAQFGRGMVEEVSKQLFRQFAECARQRLEAEAARADRGNESAAAADDTTGAPAPGAGPAPGAAAAPQVGPAAEAGGPAPDAPAATAPASTGTATTPADARPPSAPASAAPNAS